MKKRGGGRHTNLLVIYLVLLPIFASIVIAPGTNSDSPPDEWWSWGKDNAFTRFTTANAPANISNTTNISVDLGVDVDNIPIVVDNSVFMTPEYDVSRTPYELNAKNISDVIQQGDTNRQVTRSFTYYSGSLYYHCYSSLCQLSATNVSDLIDSESIGDAGYYSTPVVFNNSVYIGDGNHQDQIRQFNASNISNILSTYNSGSRIYESTPVANGYAYGATSGDLFLLNLSDLTDVIDSVDCNTASNDKFPTVGSDYVYKTCVINSIRYTVQFNATNLSQGQIANFSKTQKGHALGNGFLYFGSGTTIYQLNASNVSIQVANFTIAATVSTIPAVNSDYVFVSGGTVMYQLNASNISDQIGTYTVGGTIKGDPVIAKGFLYFGSDDNSLYQLGVYNPLISTVAETPADGYEFIDSVENVTFNCSAAAGVGLRNVSLYLSNVSGGEFAFNQSANISGTANSTVWTLELDEGNYTWNCLAYDLENSTDWGNYNQTTSSDVTDPVISFVSPTLVNDSFNSTNDFEVNVTIVESALEEIRYDWNGTNYTYYNDSLVLMYNFENVSGLNENSTFVSDLSQSGNDGTCDLGADDCPVINCTDGKYGCALQFDGTDDDVDCGSDASLDISDPITIEAWFNADVEGDSNRYVISKGAAGTDGYSLYVGGSGMDRGLTASIGDTQIKTGYVVNTGEWYHFVATDDGTTMTTYINGVINDTASSVTAADSDDNLKIGEYSTGGNNFNGLIDEVRIYNRALSADEVYQNYVSNLKAESNSSWTLYVNQSKNATDALDEGTYDYQIFAEDRKINNVSSEERNITIDRTLPTFTNITNRTHEYWSDFGFDINATDNIELDCFAVNDTNFSINCTGYLVNDTLNALGEYWLNVTINDSAGNDNWYQMFVNVTDTTSPYMTNISNASVYDLDSFAYDVNATDLHGVQCFTVNNSDFTINCTGYLQNNTGSLAIGLHTLNVTINDSSGNWNSSLMTVNVTEKPLIKVELVTPATVPVNVTRNAFFTVTANISCNRTDCGEINTTLKAIFGNTTDVDVAFACDYTSCTDADDITDYLIAQDFQVTKNHDGGWTDATLNSSSYDVIVCGGYYWYGACDNNFDNAADPARDAYENEQMPVVELSILGRAANFLGITSAVASYDGTDNHIINISNHSIMTDFSGTVGIDTNSDDVGYVTTSQINDPYTKLFAYQDGGGDEVSGFALNPGQATVGTNPGRYVWLGFRVDDTYPSTTGNDSTIIKQAVCWAATGDYDCSYAQTITNDTSVTPFYTSSRSINTTTLNENESVLITWTVNATGAADSSYNFSVEANMTADLIIGNSSESWNVTISGADTTIPVFTNLTNQTREYGDALTYNINATDGSGIGCYWINNSDFTINCTGYLENATYLEVGRYDINVTVNDTAGNNATMLMWVNITDTTIPEFTGIENETIEFDNRFDQNINATDLSDVDCFAVNDTSFTINCTGYIQNSSRLGVGFYDLNITVNDTIGNENWESFWVNITDTTNPVFSGIENTSLEFDNRFDLDINATDLNNISCFTVNNSDFTINCTGYIQNNSRLGVNQYNLNVTVNDTIGNEIWEEIWVNITDTTVPVFSGIDNATIDYNSSFAQDINATDLNNISCFTVNDTTDFSINCSGYIQNSSRLSVKRYNLNITANDTIGNEDWELIWVNVTDTVDPIVSLNLPADDYNNDTSDPFNVTFNCSATDNYNLSSVALYTTNGTNESFSLNQSSSVSGPSNSTSWVLSLANGNYTWNCLASDTSGNTDWGVNRSIIINFTDTDGDGVRDQLDNLEGNESDVNTTGVTELNITIAGNATSGSFNDTQEVVFYDESDKIINFTHNFSSSELDLSAISVIKAENSIVVNMSGQLQVGYNKTLYLDDNNFASLCVKDAEVSNISGVSSGCDGASETDFTTCIGNNAGVTLNNVTCTDEGTTFRFENLRNSAIRGTPASTSTATHGGGGGGSGISNFCGNGLCSSYYKENCSNCPQDCGECVEEDVVIGDVVEDVIVEDVVVDDVELVEETVEEEIIEKVVEKQKGMVVEESLVIEEFVDDFNKGNVFLKVLGLLLLIFFVLFIMFYNDLRKCGVLDKCKIYSTSVLGMDVFSELGIYWDKLMSYLKKVLEICWVFLLPYVGRLSMFIDDYWRMFVHYCVVCWNIVVLKSDLYFDICWSYLEKFFMFLTPYVKNALLFVERYADKAVDLLVLGVCAVFTILNNYLIKAKNFLAPYVKTGLLFVNGKRGLVVKFLTPYLVRFASTMFGKKFLYYCGEFKSLLKEIFSFP